MSVQTTSESNKVEEEKLTLLVFVNENEKALAVFGVFIALSAFFISLPLKTLSAFLAFLSLVAAIPIFFEIYKKLFTSTNRSLNLTVFSNILFLLFGYFVWYVLIAFRPQWRTELLKVIFWVIVLPLFIICRRFLVKVIINKITTFIYDRARRLDLKSEKDLEKTVQKRLAAFEKELSDSKKPEKESIELIENEKSRLREIQADARDSSKLRSEKLRDEIKTSDFFSFLISALIFSLIAYVASSVSEPTSNYLNDLLDKQAEHYRQEEQKLIVPFPDPNLSPSPNANTNTNN